MNIDPAQVDVVLATTRAVRKRLDLDRPVDNQLLLDCIDLAEQAPTGGNLGSRRWIVVRDRAVKEQLAEERKLIKDEAAHLEKEYQVMSIVSEQFKRIFHEN